jgi:hypothetical protein
VYQTSLDISVTRAPYIVEITWRESPKKGPDMLEIEYPDILEITWGAKPRGCRLMTWKYVFIWTA